MYLRDNTEITVNSSKKKHTHITQQHTENISHTSHIAQQRTSLILTTASSSMTKFCYKAKKIGENNRKSVPNVCAFWEMGKIHIGYRVSDIYLSGRVTVSAFTVNIVFFSYCVFFVIISILFLKKYSYHFLLLFVWLTIFLLMKCQNFLC